MSGRNSKPPADNTERDQRILDYLPLVHYVVGRLAVELPASFDRDDLASFGVLGLIHAAQTYDPNRGVSFKTHAYIHIRGAILDELRKLDFLPRTRREKVKKVDRAISELSQDLGRPPSPEELAAKLDVPEEEVDEMLLTARTAGLISFGDDEKGATYGIASQTDSPLDEVQRDEAKTVLAQAISELPEVERRVVVLYYSEGLLLREIGKVLGVTESRVSQIHSRALFRLNRALAPVFGGS